VQLCYGLNGQGLHLGWCDETTFPSVIAMVQGHGAGKPARQELPGDGTVAALLFRGNRKVERGSSDLSNARSSRLCAEKVVNRFHL